MPVIYEAIFQRVLFPSCSSHVSLKIRINKTKSPSVMTTNWINTTVKTIVEIERVLNMACTIFNIPNSSNVLFSKWRETESLSTQNLSGPLYQSRRRIAGGNRRLQKKPAPLPLSPPQIARELILYWTRPGAMGGRRLTS
jgi:hypothetical protein